MLLTSLGVRCNFGAAPGGIEPLIPRDVIDQVRERTDLVAIVRETVPTLKRAGRIWKGLCPFHKERSPSFTVNPDKGFFHCFGCGKHGSVIDYIMEMEGAPFPEAVRSLAERLGVEVKDESPADRDGALRQKKQKDDLYRINDLAASYFERSLRDHPLREAALAELARRSLRPSWAGGVPGASEEDQARIDDTLQAFRVGYAPGGWDGLTRHLRAQGVSLEAAQTLGLLVPRADGSSYFDRFHHRLMFAVVDPQGRVIAFSGRALEEPPDYVRAQKEGKPAKYINSPESPLYTKGHTLFGLHQARTALLQHKDKVAVLVEGNFDVVSLHARGFTNVVGALGTAVTKEQMRLLKTRAASVVFLFDADAAGEKGVRLGREACREVGLTARVATVAEGKDPDELVRSAGGVDKLQQTLDRAKGILEHTLDALLDATFKNADAYERAERVQAVAKILAEEDDPLVRSLAKAHADRLAGRLDLVRSADAFRALEQQVSKALASAGPRPTSISRFDGPRHARVSARPPGSVQRCAIVGALIDFPELLDDDDIVRALDVLDGTAAQTVAALGGALANARDGGQKALDTGLFLSQIPGTTMAFVTRRLALPTHSTKQEAKSELLMNADVLRGMRLKDETREAARTIERTTDEAEAFAMMRSARDKQYERHGTPLDLRVAKGIELTNEQGDDADLDDAIEDANE